MTLSKRQIADLKVMALTGAENHKIAAALDIPLETVHAARSHLNYTRDKVAGIPTTACDCCGSATPIDANHEWQMPDCLTTAYLCERCSMAVEYVNSFYHEDEDEDEGEDEGEDECEGEDDGAVQDN